MQFAQLWPHLFISLSIKLNIFLHFVDHASWYDNHNDYSYGSWRVSLDAVAG
jgi:hypothetical protein